MSVLIVGSTALDNVYTSHGKKLNALGGSAFYAATASSFFAPTSVCGVVGDDFPEKHLNFFKKRGVDLSGLEIVSGGKTFRWTGRYHEDMNKRDTLDLQLNVFADFKPELTDALKEKKFIFLANIDPELHLEVLAQLKKPVFIVADTMDCWIAGKRKVICRLIKKVDVFVINESEARLFSGEGNLIKAAMLIKKMGPKFVLVKKGEHGSFLWDGKEMFIAPTYPLPKLVDPTGAGDTFAGAFTGYIARTGRITPSAIRKAIVYGSVVASFACEAFSIDRLKKITMKDIENRLKAIKRMISF